MLFQMPAHRFGFTLLPVRMSRVNDSDRYWPIAIAFLKVVLKFGDFASDAH
jgi:hypothetical protein